MSDASDREVHRADPEFRKIVVLSLVIVCTGAVIGLVLLDHHLQDLEVMALTDSAAAAVALQEAARWLFRVMAAGAVLAALYMVTLSIRILKSGRYPPEGSRTIRDIEVSRGTPAKLRAVLGLLFALSFLVAGFLIPRVAENALSKVLRTAIEIQPDSFSD